MRNPATVLSVLGTRPEIIKLSCLLPRLAEVSERSVIVHSGQHYSYEMDALFFEELQLPRPDYTLNAGAAGVGPGEQTARMLSGLEPILQREQPDLVIVQGDTNTTLAGTLAAVKLGIPVLHLEAGCRSFNRNMPEEINRVLVDHVASLLLAPDEAALANLRAENCQAQASLHLVGSTGIEACLRASKLTSERPLLAALGLHPQKYLALTLHRAENTLPEVLPGLVKLINELALDQPVVFPLHPRTKACLDKYGLTLGPGVITLNPLGYLDMICLVSQAQALLTDSGGLQEEAAALGTPVLVLRNETEWSYLIKAGAAVLVGNTYPLTLDKLCDGLQPLRLAAMRDAVVEMPLNTTQAVLDVIAGFLQTRPVEALSYVTK